MAGTQIFVTAGEGAVTLFGRVHYPAQAEMAEKVALCVEGIVAVAEELIVSNPKLLTESDIARLAARALQLAPHVPGTIRAIVRGHTLTLSGQVNWQYQRDAACRAVKDIDDVESIVDSVTVRARTLTAELTTDIASAVATMPPFEPSDIKVKANTLGALTLEGTAPTRAAQSRANSICWAVPGVTAVLDHLDVGRPAG